MNNKEIDLINEDPIAYSNLYFSNKDKELNHISRLKEYDARNLTDKIRNLNLDNINYKNIIKTYDNEYKEGDIIIYDNKIDVKIIENINVNMIPKCIWNIQVSNKKIDECPIFFKFSLQNNKYFESLFYNYIIPNIEF